MWRPEISRPGISGSSCAVDLDCHIGTVILALSSCEMGDERKRLDWAAVKTPLNLRLLFSSIDFTSPDFLWRLRRFEIYMWKVDVYPCLRVFI